MVPPGSLAREFTLWMVAAVFIHAAQLFFVTIIILAAGMIIAAAPSWPLLQTLGTALGFVVMAGFCVWFITYLGIIPWVHRTRFFLRGHEEALAQGGETVPMRSQDLVLTFTSRAWSYQWVPHNEVLEPLYVKRLSARPQRWLTDVNTVRRFPYLG